MELRDREFLYIISSALLLIIAMVVTTKKPERSDRSRIFLILYLALAEECGFQSRTTFIRAFKQYTGITPSEYLARLQ